MDPSRTPDADSASIAPSESPAAHDVRDDVIEHLHARIDELEVKLSFQHERIEHLNDAMVEQTRRTLDAEATLTRVQEALLRLATREPKGEVAGAHPELDPVPRSG